MAINITLLKNDLKKVSQICLNIPTISIYRKYGKYSVNTIKRTWGTWNKALIEIFRQTNQSKHHLRAVGCPTCETEFKQKYITQKYCSRKCANIFNNKQRKILSTKCCEKRQQVKGEDLLGDKTVRSVLDDGSNRYGVIRCHARKVVRDRPYMCEKCGYLKHVEICHKKHISEYSIDTKIKHINSKDNLVLLCPNCHWELDNGR